ncbi:cAMP phosphodiesterases class-II-domain-containing protein [Aspergillus multicolor]|uniref:3',5'-cyclic-nucleotide phosphodiesterase PDE1 n=1 Tax=Aspergillus multicolor TaxID=41759 RepID=UPI003CCCDF62
MFPKKNSSTVLSVDKPKVAGRPKKAVAPDDKTSRVAKGSHADERSQDGQGSHSASPHADKGGHDSRGTQADQGSQDDKGEHGDKGRQVDRGSRDNQNTPADTESSEDKGKEKDQDHSQPSRTGDERYNSPVFFSTDDEPLSDAKSMDSAEFRDSSSHGDHNDKETEPALHVVVLGPTGGPREDRITGILVRSTASNWNPNSMVAVDAGTLLGGLVHAAEQCETENGVVTSGPFVGLHLPHRTAGANAKHIFESIIGRILITHPHLDHLSGLAINLPALTKGNSSKIVAALPSVIEAMKTHIFNNLIWPNLSDEDEGVGLITYQRLADGGNPMLGHGEENGYIEVGSGLLVRGLGISHGKCKVKTGTRTYAVEESPSSNIPAKGQHGQDMGSIASHARQSPSGQEALFTTVESSAFLLRDQKTGKEIIIFGDVEPDSVSLNPRNKKIWEIAAPKVASGNLCAIFIECSYTDAINDLYLFGHLCPRHLASELFVLCELVAKIKDISWSPSPKRKRQSSAELSAGEGSSRRAGSKSKSVSPRSSSKRRAPSEGRLRQATGSSESAPLDVDRQTLHNRASDSEDIPEAKKPLAGLSVYVIHVKELLQDEEDAAETILQQLIDVEAIHHMGVEFHVPKRGESIYF